MTRYADLSPYEYVPDSVPEGVAALNIGWLEPGDPYPQGDVPQEFAESLGVLCRDEPRMMTRGWHRCQLEHPDVERPYPLMVNVGEDELALGSAEVRVLAEDGTWLVAPNLVLHYVTAHGYRPPQPFVEAVTARRSVGEA